MRVFFKKSLKEIQEENISLKKELELTQEVVNEILFNSLGGE